MAETIGGGGEWTALRERLERIIRKCEQYWNAEGLCDAEVHAALGNIYTDARAILEALAAAAPAPPTNLQVGHDESRGDLCEGNSSGLRTESPSTFSPPPQDGQEAELLGPPRGGSSSDLAESDSLNVGDVVLVEAMVSGIARFEDGQAGPEDLLHLRVGNGHGSIVRRCVWRRPDEAVAGNASAPVGEKSGTVAPDEELSNIINKFIDVPATEPTKFNEFFHALEALIAKRAGQPSGVGEPRDVKQRAYHDCLTIARSFGGVIAGRIQEAIARTADEAYAADGLVAPLEVGEGLREALKQWKCPACNGTRFYSGYSAKAPAGTPCRKCKDTDGLHPIAYAALAATAPKPAATLADYCDRCKAGQLREYRTVVMPEPYGGTGWWHWSPNAEWPNSTEKGAWFTCQVQSVAPKPAPPAEPTVPTIGNLALTPGCIRTKTFEHDVRRAAERKPPR